MTNLVNLNLSCSKVTNAGLPAVRGLHGLQKLGLDTRHVSDVGLATITSTTRVAGGEVDRCPIRNTKVIDDSDSG